MKSVALNFILFFFPIMCYFLYMLYNKTKLKEENYLFYDLMTITSCYLVSRFGILNKYNIYLFIVILFLSLYKDRKGCYLLISIYMFIFFTNSYNINKYILIIILLGVLVAKKYLTIKIDRLFLITSFIILIVIMFAEYNSFSYIKVSRLIVHLLLSYILFRIVCYLYNKTEDLINAFLSLDSIIKEKKLYESLFKITHEIKNPLAVCKGYLDMFDVKNEKKSSRYVGIISQEIDRTLLLLNDFSNISKMKIEKRDMDITLLIDDVCDEVSLIFDNKIKFIKKFSDEEVIINADYNRLKQVLINVIKNAKEAIMDTGTVTLIGNKKNYNYKIIIEDDGMGMDKETYKNIGTAFYTTKKNGTGLGVCLSKEIIDRHGGTITYKPRKNRGTLCVITIPIKNT